MHYLEKMVKDNNINGLEELLGYDNSKTKILLPLPSGRTVLAEALEYNRYEMVNLLAKKGFLEFIKHPWAEHVIKHKKMNEATKLKYLQLFHYYDVKINTEFPVSPQSGGNKKILRYTILEYAVDMDFLQIFNWLLKIKVAKKNKYEESLLSLALKNDTLKIARAIIENRTLLKPKDLLTHSLDSNNPSLLMIFYKHWLNSSAKEERNFQPNILIEKAKFLTKHGYDINETDLNNETILHYLTYLYALIDTHININEEMTREVNEFAKYLKDKTDIDLQHKNKSGKTAYEIIEDIKMKDKFKQKMILNIFKY